LIDRSKVLKFEYVLTA